MWSLNGNRRDLDQDTRAQRGIFVHAKSEEWLANKAGIQEEANRKRSEAAKEQPRAANGTMKRKPVVGQKCPTTGEVARTAKQERPKQLRWASTPGPSPAGTNPPRLGRECAYGHLQTLVSVTANPVSVKQNYRGGRLSTDTRFCKISQLPQPRFTLLTPQRHTALAGGAEAGVEQAVSVTFSRHSRRFTPHRRDRQPPPARKPPKPGRNCTYTLP